MLRGVSILITPSWKSHGNQVCMAFHGVVAYDIDVHDKVIWDDVDDYDNVDMKWCWDEMLLMMIMSLRWDDVDVDNVIEMRWCHCDYVCYVCTWGMQWPCWISLVGEIERLHSF